MKKIDELMLFVKGTVDLVKRGVDHEVGKGLLQYGIAQIEGGLEAYFDDIEKEIKGLQADVRSAEAAHDRCMDERDDWKRKYEDRDLVDAEFAPWTGEGLPPVGTVCEFQGDIAACPSDPWRDGLRDGVECTVIAHFKSKGLDLIAFTFTKPDGCSEVEQAQPGALRPVRTAEQIAAEEREAAIKVMVEGSQPDYSAGELLNASEYVECAISALYDAGYRKQDNGARWSKVEPIQDMASLALGKKMQP